MSPDCSGLGSGELDSLQPPALTEAALGCRAASSLTSASGAQRFDPTVTSCSRESLTAAQGIMQREEIATGLGYAQFFPTEKQFATENKEKKKSL